MGQHKTNPTAIAAAKGEIQPKHKMTKTEMRRAVAAMIRDKQLPPDVMRTLSEVKYQ